MKPQGAQLGALRSGAKTETLTLDFGKSGTCAVNDATWRKHNDGDKVKIQVRTRSERVVCDGLWRLSFDPVVSGDRFEPRT